MKLPFEGFSFVQLAHAVVANVSRAPSSVPSVPLLPFFSPHLYAKFQALGLRRGVAAMQRSGQD
jgi:hypothetical protein